MSDTQETAEEAVLNTIEDKKKIKKPVRQSLSDRKRPEKFKLSQEVAEDNLTQFLDFYEIYPEELPSEPEKDAVHTAINKLIIAVRKGWLTFKEDGTCVQRLKNKTEIKYGVLSGASKVQNKHRKNESEDAMRTNRLYAMMGSLAGLGAEDMRKFTALDLSTMECLGFLLSTV